MSVPNGIELREGEVPPRGQVLRLYRENAWSSADRPEELLAALTGSHALVTAWAGGELVGLGNAISDGALVVYFPHMLVRPAWQGRGVGRAILDRLKARYAGFHQQVLLADAPAVGFYERAGFVPTAGAEALWIYAGDDH